MSGGIIYLITCRPTGKCYVGQTTRPLAERWAQHRNPGSGRVNRALFAAIQKHGAAVFDVREIERVPTVADLDSRELHWSVVHNTLSPSGYNLRVGGGPTARFSEATVAILAHHNRERAADPTVRERTSRWMRERWADPTKRASMLAAMLRNLHAPEVEARRSATQSRVQKTVQGTPSARLRRAAISRSAWADPDTRQRIMRAHRIAMESPETRARMRRAASERANRHGAQARRVASRQASRADRAGKW